MIGSKHRFHGNKSIAFVYKKGKTIHSQRAALKFVKNPKRNKYRLAVVVSKKVHKSAVARNRIRRRIYEIVRQHEPKISEPYDIVITVYSSELKDLPHNELKNLITELLSKLD